MSTLAAEDPSKKPNGNYYWFVDQNEGTIKIFRTIYPNQLRAVMVLGLYDSSIPSKLLNELPNMICDYLTDNTDLEMEPEVLARIRNPVTDKPEDPQDSTYTP